MLTKGLYALYLLLAQLDRAFGRDPMRYKFESCRGDHKCRYRLMGRAILVAPSTTSVRVRLSAPYSVTLRPLGLRTCGSNESLPTCCAQIKFPNNTLKWGVGVTITYTKEMALVKNHLQWIVMLMVNKLIANQSGCLKSSLEGSSPSLSAIK